MHPPGIPGYILRLFQFIFGVIVLSLAAALVANQPSGGSPSQINYSVFVGVFSLLSWFYTVIASSFSSEGIGSPVIIIILDSLNSLFYFCGGIAMAVAMRVHSCGNIAYVFTNRITAGSTQRCHEGQALTAFLWFGTTKLNIKINLAGFATYLISAILTGVLSSYAGVSMGHKRGGVVGPPMSSV